MADVKEETPPPEDGQDDGAIEAPLIEEEAPDVSPEAPPVQQEDKPFNPAYSAVIDVDEGIVRRPHIAVAPSLRLSKSKSGVMRRMVRRASVKMYVDTLKPFAITFQDLSVYVPKEKGCGESMNAIRCLFKPMAHCAVEYLNTAVEQRDPYYALQETTGYVQSGEMVLVLSPDTQYSSALIQVLTGRLSDKYQVVGSVRVNGTPIPTNVMQGWRRIAAHVSSDDGTHAPVLTVRETLRFAAECTHSADVTADKIDDVVNEVMEILDLTGVADTVVGDENLRGISGGQKRRVTVGEMLVAKGTRFLGLENITDGLSSQDSFNIIKELKGACDSFNSAAVISLNQPSDEIVQLFDNILVLNDQGELTYFGPPDNRAQLKEIFLTNQGDDTETTAMSICDLCLSSMTDEEAAKVIKEQYVESPLYEDLQQSLRVLNKPKTFTARVTDLLPATKYASGFAHNYKILGKRRVLLIKRNPSTYLRIVAAIFFGVIIGSLFSVLTQDLPSSLARTGYIFQNLFLVLLLSTGVTVPQNIRDRITYFKHRSAEFYSSRVYYLCQILYELPLSIVEAILLTVTSYWWVDLNPGTSQFFFYLGVMIAMEFVGLALGRLFCAVSRTQVVAKSVVSVATLLFSTVSGFMPKYMQIPPIFRWLSWISPPAYGFEAMAINEYVGRELTGLTMSTDGGTETSVGTVSGEEWLNILQIPRVQWTSLQGIKIFDIIMLFILAGATDLVGLLLMERSRRNFFSQLRRPQRTGKSVSFTSDKGEGGVPDPLKWPSSLSISNLCYSVRLKGEAAPKRCSMTSIFGPLLLGKLKGKQEVAKTPEINELQLLNNVTATFGAGRATALMGTSGAGKTTLLDVIAGYKTGGRITGDLTLNGLPKDKKIWTLLAGYAEQNDLLNPYLTVLETLKFTASCRLPASMNRAGVIDRVIAVMSLEDWTDYVVGVENEGEGIPKHVRKRLTIAVQLVMLPKILFLDEPTTGLGTSAANLVMRAIRRSTTEMNLITVATIHQPSKLIWDCFDDLLLLTKGGKVAYCGEMGPTSQKVIGYFSRLTSKSMPENSNPADYVISSVSSVTPDEAQSTFANSEEQKELTAKLNEENSMNDDERQAATDMMQNAKAELAKRKSVLRELGILTKRQLITQWRNPNYSITRIFCSVLLAIYFGILFGGDKSTIEGAILTIGSTFFLVFVLVVPMQAAVVPLIADRAVLYREATSGLYSRWSYAFANILADIPFHVLNGLLMFVGFYFIVGFQLEDDRPWYFIVMIFFCNWAFTSIGELYAVVTPNEEAANGLAGLTTILSVLFMGFLIQVDKMPVYWQWANTADLLRYVIQGLTSNEMGDNYYKLFPDDAESNMTIFGDVTNATDLFLVPGGTDISPGSDANQGANLVNLFLQASPAGSADWNSSFLVVLENFIDCGVLNECFVEPIATSFLGCFILNFPRRAPCADEFDAFTNATADSADRIFECLAKDDDAGGNTTRNLQLFGGSTNEIGGTNETITSDDEFSLPGGIIGSNDEFSLLPQEVKDRIMFCIVDSVLPAGLIQQMTDYVTDTVETLTGVATVVINIAEVLKYGLPGEVILFVFGWAEFQDGELVAPYKWWYCMFSVFMFVLGIELFKVFSTRFIIWTKR